ncbi:hypothetical protein TARUN_5342 [Trichoderma arundinaceum]|uniref:Uncharacterized protein n=1 Tax=Trichoderma arundinaceum TaxID=490622 RepID=A0A395NLC2_TRIAR|nr:hypothetical protein TARUN_5342 [Trichoderma arundinaceum]
MKATQRVIFHINYAKSVYDIYVGAAKAMVASDGLRDVLSEACGLESSEYDLPTWAADWSITQRSWEAIYTTAWSILINLLPPDFAGPSTFSASTLNSPPKFGASNMLIVNGVVYGQIKGLTSRYPVSSSNTATSAIGLAKEVGHWLESCDSLAEDCIAGMSPGTSNKQDMFW